MFNEPGRFEVLLLLSYPGAETRVAATQLVTVLAATVADSVATLHIDKTTYSSTEPIAVQFAGMSGSQTDWITIAKPESSPGSFGDWKYTNGQTEGQIAFPPQKPGRYEIRAHFDHPDGGNEIHARVQVTVEGPTTVIAPNNSVSQPDALQSNKDEQKNLTSSNVAGGHLFAERWNYRPQEEIIVRYADLPGNRTDWITIVPVGSPAESYKFWKFTDSKTDGMLVIPPQNPGQYEIRLFYNWPDGQYNIQHSIFVNVAPGGTGTP